MNPLEVKLYQDETLKTRNPGFLNKMASWYFKPKSFERNGKLYELFGIKIFKKGVVKIGKKVAGNEKVNHANNYYLWDSSQEGLEAFDYKTRRNESIHLTWAAYSGILASTEFMANNLGSCEFQTGLIILNLYCVMLQRYNRARLHNAIDRIEARKINSTHS